MHYCNAVSVILHDNIDVVHSWLHGLVTAWDFIVMWYVAIIEPKPQFSRYSSFIKSVVRNRIEGLPKIHVYWLCLQKLFYELYVL